MGCLSAVPIEDLAVVTLADLFPRVVVRRGAHLSEVVHVEALIRQSDDVYVSVVGVLVLDGEPAQARVFSLSLRHDGLDTARQLAKALGIEAAELMAQPPEPQS
jgi:hypothetical protein